VSAEYVYYKSTMTTTLASAVTEFSVIVGGCNELMQIKAVF